MFKLGAVPWRALAKTGAVLIAVAFAVSTCSGLREFEAEISEMEGVEIGEPLAEVRYRLGIPERVLAEMSPIEVDGQVWGDARIVYWVENPPQPVNALPEGTKIEDYSAWEYVRTENATFTVEFGPNGTVEGLECTARPAAPTYSCGPVAGIWNRDTEEQVLRMGRPTREQIVGVTKLMVYEDIGVYFRLTKGRVYQIGLIPPARKSSAAIGRYFERRFP